MARNSTSAADYQSRRDFRRTPEPAFEAAAPDAPAAEGSFVVHRHEARRLHYDLRLAAGGVLVSWAVPRGFCYDPAIKHLAVHTEDHPLSYRTFEGVIPKGQYGAGTMLIWDQGSYEVVNAAAALGEADLDALSGALAAGEVKVILRGRRLRGEWHLVRTDDEQDEWLLFKARDRYARSADEPVPVVDTRARPARLPDRPAAMRPATTTTRFSTRGGCSSWSSMACARWPRCATVGWCWHGRAARPSSCTRGPPASWPQRSAGCAPTRQCSTGCWWHWTPVAARPAVQSTPGSQGRTAAETAQPTRAPGRRPSTTRSTCCTMTSGICARYRWWSASSSCGGCCPQPGGCCTWTHVAGSGDQLAATAAAAGFHGLMAKRADGAYRAGEQPGWRRIRLPADHDAGRLEVHDALARTTRQRRRHTRFPLSNLDKVFWPREGYTKGDLLHYYEQVAEYLLPYLRERPVHMNRFPDGIAGKSFFQRQAPTGVPDWVELVEVDAEHDRQFVCNDVQTLIYLINLGSIELHPWLSRRGSLDSPDFAVLDLDAKETTFGNAKRVARTAGKVLRGIGLDPALKTSGATGLHIYVPLIPGYGYDQARLFMEAVARVVAREHPDIASVERLPRGRGGKVYVDFLQNRKSATVVPPYAARPVPEASVSMPLDWDELDDDLHPGRFTIKNTPALLARRGDRFRPTLTDRQDFAPRH